MNEKGAYLQEVTLFCGTVPSNGAKLLKCFWGVRVKKISSFGIVLKSRHYLFLTQIQL